jgi:RNA recognition motif-containing protein
MDDDWLHEVFSAFGKVDSVKVQRDPITGESKLFGFVCFEQVGDAQRCIKESVLLRFYGQQAYVSEKMRPAQRQREEGVQHVSDPLEGLRRKIEVVKPDWLAQKLYGYIKRMSDQQAAALLEDDRLFRRWVQAS